ncbi:MAG: hypothetical protein RBT73_10920 [Spirochaetia bacterium]|jgi:hypothetical protein|nr:hypothetical protein [Spirochaetia bacterium]
MKSETKALLLAACACAFLSVLATFDLSEHHRAWRTAKTWTEEQRRVASALDADSIQPLILAALIDNTLIVALSFAGILMLGIAVASDGRASFYTAKVIIWNILILGITLILLIILYKLKLGSRMLLKGPIYDYNLRLQPPLLLALAGYPLVVIGFAFNCLQRSRADSAS